MKGIKSKTSKYGLLADALFTLIENNKIQSGFLGNKTKEIENIESEGRPFATVGFDHHYILTLATFAGIDDYPSLDLTFGPVLNFPVLFTAKPFRLLSFIRIPTSGYLSTLGQEWIFKDLQQNEIKGNVRSVQPYTMPGNRLPLWIQVKTDQTTYYFADGATEALKPVQESDALFSIFDHLVDEASLMP